MIAQIINQARWIAIYVCTFLFCSSSYAFNLHPSAIMSGGFGSYQNVYKTDGSTAILRLAVGDDYPVTRRLFAGVELGVQTGNRMRLSSATVQPLQYVTLPFFITIHPQIDFLLTAKFNIFDTGYLLGKLGAAYVNMLSDNQTITTYSFIKPELQLGAGYHFTSTSAIELFYQHIHGNELLLHNVDVATGTASLDASPTLDAVFLAVRLNLN